jgi:glycosyltransferase involved in cell wall biosynthesis
MSDSTPSTVSGISVVVPVLNEANSIRTLIEGLMNQTLRPTEIVITDGGSTDGTTSIVEQLMAAGAPAKLLREKRALPGRGRNVGVSNSQCDWIAFIDGGIIPEPIWLEKLAVTAEQEAADIVFGSYQPVIDTFFKECAAIAYVAPPQETNGVLGRFGVIVSTLINRKVFKEVGGFPEDLRSAEDLVFMRKMEAAGFHVAYAPDAIVHWNLQPNLWRTFRRFTTYARSNIRAGLWREWQLAIFVRYAFLLLFAVPAVFAGWWWLVVPAGLWLGMMMARACKSILRNRRIYPANPARNMARLVVLIQILTVIDLSVAIGSIAWLVWDARRDYARSKQIQ